MPNKWIEFVKNYSKNNNINYPQALSSPKCKEEYQKTKEKPKVKKVKVKEEPKIEQIKEELKDEPKIFFIIGDVIYDYKKFKKNKKINKIKFSGIIYKIDRKKEIYYINPITYEKKFEIVNNKLIESTTDNIILLNKMFHPNKNFEIKFKHAKQF
jgi:predicted HAD superfamily phosphohydrolase